ncbi:hypothetical protein DFH08DRAFT_1049153 [Mycena albidolilacea]|uniref:Fido domain-containing protein n=1 Tax=Mycena albidolilacea TaxID=1033008 RepID=A0AAD7AG73_9AGAR|nr:hypothetical protein DFH08DRAFT_1049153 [Mycena albidolilacea]
MSFPPLLLWAAARLSVPGLDSKRPSNIFPFNSDQLFKFSSSLQRAANRESRLLHLDRRDGWAASTASRPEGPTPPSTGLVTPTPVFWIVKTVKIRQSRRNTGPVRALQALGFPLDLSAPSPRPASTSAKNKLYSPDGALCQPLENGKRYLRYNLIQSNEIEGVFHLGSAAALGLLVLFQLNNAVVHIESDSLILKSAIIVRVLQNSNVALQMISKVACGELPPNVASCCELHEIISRETRFSSVDKGDDFPSTVALRLGAFRGEPSFTTLPADENAIVEFAPHHDLPALFESLIATIRALQADSDVSPFILAAYFHHLFLCTHPFSDGNGRLGRMIASLYLFRVQGPPLLIANSQRVIS